jgi:glycosyltransferase involved in cell wall biosynthesis
MSDAEPRPTVSAVMPVLNGMGYLERSLPPLLARVGEDLLEVIVVDDGSGDGSGDWAKAQGARVLRSERSEGPGAARNRAAQVAQGEILLFVDADVVAHADAVARAREALQDPQVVAVFGSYDDAPPDPAFASQYMNLRHHHTHQRGAGEASTFWAGLGAVRREAFLAAGGYDAGRYAVPSIEDIELGYRLREAGGRLRLVPAMQGTHLKRWSLRGVIETDVFRRAIPWSRLLVSRPDVPADLNAGRSEQGRALLAGLLALSVLLALVGRAPAWVPLVLFAATLLANRSLFSVFRRRRGWPFAVLALGFHQLYYLYSAAAFAGCWLERRIAPKRAAGTGGAAR